MPLIDLNGLGHFKEKENAMTAAEYSATKTYSVGDYVYYNGTLYKCTTAITTAEAWTAGHWTPAKLAEDVSDLKNAIDALDDSLTLQTLVGTPWVQGYLRDNGTVGNESKYCTTSNYVAITGRANILLGDGYSIKYIRYNASYDTLEIARSNSSITIDDADTAYLKIQIGSNPATAITPSDITTDIISVYDNVRYADVSYIDGRSNVLRIDLERGSFLSSERRSNTMAAFGTYYRNAYSVDIFDAQKFDIDFVANDAEYKTVYFYDAQHTLIGYTNIASIKATNISIPQSTRYINVEFVSAEECDKVLTVFYGATTLARQIKRYPVGVDEDGTESTTIAVDDNIATTIRIILPPNYTSGGKKVPLILYLDGSGNFVSWDAAITTAAKLPNLYYARDEGYAILSVFGWGSNMYNKYADCGRAMHYPTPTNIACVKAGLEYAIDRYNIDPDNVHLVCKSQGGQLGTYCVTNPIYDFRSIGMFCPVNDYLSMPSTDYYVDARKALVDDLELADADTYGFTSTGFNTYSANGRAFWAANLDRLIQLNEAWTGLIGGSVSDRYTSAMDDGAAYWANPDASDIYNNAGYTKMGCVPVKIWACTKDRDTPYLKSVEIISQFKNGGLGAEICLNYGGNHNSWDVTTKVDDITTALGIHYDTVTAGWVDAIKWIRLHAPK